MKRVIRNATIIGVLSALASFGAARVFPSGPPVLSVELGNTVINWMVPVTPAEYEECVAEVAQVWTGEFDIYNGQSWVGEGDLSPWGWEQRCFLLPPGVSALDAVGDIGRLEVWVDNEVVSQFVWTQADGASPGRALVVNNAERVFGMFGAGKAPPEVVSDIEPYLDHVMSIAMSAAMADGAEEVPQNCTGGYSFGAERATPPSVPFRCTVFVEGFEDAPDSFAIDLKVVLEDGQEFSYP